jgi:hypothetical protein
MHIDAYIGILTQIWGNVKRKTRLLADKGRMLGANAEKRKEFLVIMRKILDRAAGFCYTRSVGRKVKNLYKQGRHGQKCTESHRRLPRRA